jgi:hypothetical protein
MTAFRGVMVVFTFVCNVAGGFALYDSAARPAPSASSGVIGGAVLCSLALILLYFLARTPDR